MFICFRIYKVYRERRRSLWKCEHFQEGSESLNGEKEKADLVKNHSDPQYYFANHNQQSRIFTLNDMRDPIYQSIDELKPKKKRPEYKFGDKSDQLNKVVYDTIAIKETAKFRPLTPLMVKKWYQYK